jgi:4-amino-4-deoxy-L-arabinose transferase-like glycosyltransferase
MKPARLPMPETFKEPGYPYAIALLAPRVGGEFRAAVLLSFLAGLLMPLALFGLARSVGLDRGEATLAAILAAASPLSILMSVRVTVDSLFPALLTLAFFLAAWRRGEGAAARPWWADVLTGVAAGLAFLVRGQALVAAPALVVVLAMRRPGRGAWAGPAIAAATAIVVASPFLIRNLRLFGVPFYSDVGAYGLWPYVDHLTFSHGLDRPPAPLLFALHHVPDVLRHIGESIVRFCVYALPGEITGNPIWVLPFAAGLLLSIGRWRTFLGLWLYLAATVVFIFAINWDGRYFTSTVPLGSLFTALGAMWLARAAGPLPIVGRLRGRHLLIAALIAAVLVQTEVTRRRVAHYKAPETDAAIAEAPFLRSHLAPGESVMVVTTSFWSWFVDRPSVHLVIAGDEAFAETVRRLRVRYAALPTSRLPEFAERYPGGHLPRILVVDHVDSLRDVTVFRVVGL